jgi:TPR repeat protein
MTDDNRNLPIKAPAQSIVAASIASGSLVARALADIESSKKLALGKTSQDRRYREARAVYEKQIGNQGKKAWTAEEMTTLVAAFETLRELAIDGYGKAYFPLAVFYIAGWCSKWVDDRYLWVEDKYGYGHSDRHLVLDARGHARHFYTLAFEWCTANQTDQDTELWLDLADCYGEHRGFNGGASVEGYDDEAVRWYRRAAEKCDVRAQYKLGVMYFEGRGVTKNAAQAVHWYRKAAEQDYSAAQFALGLTCGDDQAVHWFRKAAKQGDVYAQCRLGLMYEEGRGVTQDDEQAVHWFREAANQGSAEGQYLLGGMYEYGRGVVPDVDQAVYWYDKAAAQGDARAQRDLEGIYEVGHGGVLDEEQAMYWNLKAARQGHRWAQSNLGLMYEKGLRVPKKAKLAAYWYERAAECDTQNETKAESVLSGDTDAERLFTQGLRYRRGLDGTPQDDDKAQGFFLSAAKLGHAEAQLELALLLIENSEDAEAKLWLENASNLGYGPAQYTFGRADYDLPEGEADVLLEKAFVWYAKRAEDGDTERQFEFATYFELDRTEKLRWLKAAADQDHQLACRRLGYEYLHAEVNKNTTRDGMHWLERAANLGDAMACESLGNLYLLGHAGGLYASRGKRSLPRRIEPDKKTAVAWYERAIEQGRRSTAYQLGRLYLDGEHISQDLQLAEKLLLRSAYDGYDSAQILLGKEYASGARLRQDVDAAIRWLKLAAESSSRASLQLAQIYLEGKILQKNFDEAMKWLKLEANRSRIKNHAMKVIAKYFDSGLSDVEQTTAQAWLAQMATITLDSVVDMKDSRANHNAFNLAELYELGLGVKQDCEEAIYWYKQSAELGLWAAKKRLQELGVDWKSA